MEFINKLTMKQTYYFGRAYLKEVWARDQYNHVLCYGIGVTWLYSREKHARLSRSLPSRFA